jgi:stearoyl-CoA desaturase (delta-9 desaturase)
MDSEATVEPAARAEAGILRALRAKNLRQVLIFDGAPLFSLPVAVALVAARGISAGELAIAVASYVLVIAGVTVGYHRLLAHRTFQAPPIARAGWAVLGSMAALGPPLYWVAVHRQHHEMSDRPGDPHSPYGRGGTWRGFWHAHMGWLLEHDPPNLLRYARDLVSDDALVWVQRHYLKWVALGLALPAAVGYVAIGGLQGALLGAFWGGPVRLALVHQLGFSVDSVSHLWGTQPYETGDGSRNTWWLAWATLGESWHNNHHAAPGSARFGHAWYQLDVGYGIIRLTARLGAASGVKTPSGETLARRRAET